MPWTGDRRRTGLVMVGLFTMLLASMAVAQDIAPSVEPAAPWELLRWTPGEPRFAPLLRIRGQEATYRDTRWWTTYTQLLAQSEATAGNHHAALRAWDSALSARDSVGVLPEGTHAAGAVELLAAIADTARVVMVNERHHAASDRLLTLRLLGALKMKGYRYFAAEAFDERDSTLNSRAYPVVATGGYTAEPVFAEVVREALRLGYTLVPYEQTRRQREEESDLTTQQRRDRAQAQNLYERTLQNDREGKVLVHAGFSHILEETTGNWHPMAVYFGKISGIDPVTVDQTRLSERSAPEFEHPVYRAAIAKGLVREEPVVLIDSTGSPFSPAALSVDINVLTPRTVFSNGRPGWMDLGGRRVSVDLQVPECRSQVCFVEARAVDEPLDAIPLDRADVNRAGSVQLFLPPGRRIDVQVLDASGDVLQRFEQVIEDPQSR